MEREPLVDTRHLTKLRGFGWGVAFAWLTLFARPGPAWGASPSSADKASSESVERAASFFEQGVEHFVAERFEAAARAFLDADRILPSADALGNALSAARRSHVDLLILRVAREVLVRGDTTEPLRFAAREAIAESEPRVSQAVLQCTRPCTLTIDGTEALPGLHDLSPGSHHITATFGEAEAVDRREDFRAGARLTLTFEPPPASEKAPAPAPVGAGSFDTPPENAPGPAPPGPSSTRAEKPRAASVVRQVQPDLEDSAPESSRLPGDRILFYSGVAATLGLVTAATVSGVDAVSYHNGIGDVPSPVEREENSARALRTDVLVGASVGAALLTAAWGVFGVEWRPVQKTRVSISADHLGFVTGGNF